jgi:hypothetical protein
VNAVEPSFDGRTGHEGKPGVHALVIGISHYVNLPTGSTLTKRQRRYGLGLRQLNCAARTGRMVFDWLIKERAGLPVPLATCRLLLSPVDGEMDGWSDPDLGVASANLHAVLETAAQWREDAASHPDNVTLFYFVGHGFQNERGKHVLILADIGDGIGPRLKNAIDADSLIGGMAPSDEYPQVARQQFYFFDACRIPSVEASKYETMPATLVWDPPVLTEKGFDDRSAPVYHTTEPGRRAFAAPGDQTLFSKALLRCLQGDGAEELDGDRWGITAASLVRGLEHHMEAMEKLYKARQRIKVDDSSTKAILYRLSKPPRVDIDVALMPAHEAGKVRLTLTNHNLPVETFGPPLKPHPFRIRPRAGAYEVTVTCAGNDNGPRRRILTVAPPPKGWSLSV